MSDLKRFFVLGLPNKENRCPNSIYFVKTGIDSISIFVTDKLKNAYQPTSDELKSEIRPFERIVGLADSVLNEVTDVKEALRQSINTLTTPLTIEKGTFPIIRFLFKNTIYRLTLDVPHGIYGIGGSKLDTVEYIITISKETLNLGSVQESIRETIDLGVIGTSSIEYAVNQSSYTIRDLSLGYTAFRAQQEVDGVLEEKIWLYTGNSGLIGVGGYPTVNSDYLELNPNTSSTPSLQEVIDVDSNYTFAQFPSGVEIEDDGGGLQFIAPNQGNFGIDPDGAINIDSNSNRLRIQNSQSSDEGKILKVNAQGFFELNEDILPTGLEAIDEGNGVGWRLIGTNPNHYGNIGLHSIDLSEGSASEPGGAIGGTSFTTGFGTTASGFYSDAGGSNTIASGHNSTARGVNTEASANISFALGYFNKARAEGEISGGVAGTDYVPFNPNNFDGRDRLFNLGNGTFQNRRDAFTIYKNGAVRFFRAALASITNVVKEGFLIFNSEDNNRPYINNGTDWKGLAYTDELGIENITQIPKRNYNDLQNLPNYGVLNVAFIIGSYTPVNDFEIFYFPDVDNAYLYVNPSININLNNCRFRIIQNGVSFDLGEKVTINTPNAHEVYPIPSNAISGLNSNIDYGFTFWRKEINYNDLQDLPDLFELEGTQYVYVKADGTDVENATELQNAYNTAKTMSPTATNRITIICGAGNYNFASDFVMDEEHIDLVSLDGNKSIIFNGTGTINITANDVFVKGVNVLAKNFAIADDLNLLKVENCEGGNGSFGSFRTASGTFNNCIGSNVSFGGGGTASGTFTDCVGGTQSFGSNYLGIGGTASGTFTNCQGGNESFGSMSTASGTFTDCVGGGAAFGGGGGTASGTFTNCQGGENSFASGGTASGTFTNCQGGENTFGGFNSGSFQAGTASGKFTNCQGGNGSFGGGGTLNGKLFYCRLTDGTFQTVSEDGITRLCIDGLNVENNQG